MAERSIKTCKLNLAHSFTKPAEAERIARAAAPMQRGPETTETLFRMVLYIGGCPARGVKMSMCSRTDTDHQATKKYCAVGFGTWVLSTYHQIPCREDKALRPLVICSWTLLGLSLYLPNPTPPPSSILQFHARAYRREPYDSLLHLLRLPPILYSIIRAE